MKMKIKYFVIAIIILAFGMDAFGQSTTKMAQTGMKFLGVSLGARASALADAMTSVEDFSSMSMFYNPAGMARINGMTDVNVGTVRWLADINYLWGAAAIKPFDGKYGVLGLSFLYVDYGEFIGTVRANNSQGFVETGNFKPKAYSFGLGYAKEMSDKFSIGGNVKYVYQNLGSARTSYEKVITPIDSVKSDTQLVPVSKEYTKGALAFDFGVIYKTGYKSLTFGMNIRNFSTEVKYIEEEFQLPLVFKIGLSMDLIDLTKMDKDMYSFLFAVEAIHHRDYPEQMNIGGEFTFMKMLNLRIGYSFPNDERNISYGVGIGKELAGITTKIDYSYVPFGRFDPVHRFSVSFGF